MAVQVNRNTQSEKTGVNAVTLRAWQRRYGLLKPVRTPKGHRLYTEDDVAVILEIVSWLNKGVPVSQVKALLGSATPESEDVKMLPEWNALKAAVMKLDAVSVESQLLDLTRSYPLSVLETKLITPLTQWLESQHTELATLCTQIWHSVLNNVLVHCLHRSHKRNARKRCWLVGFSREPSYLFYLKALALQSEGYAVTWLIGIDTGLTMLANNLLDKGIDRLVLYSDHALTASVKRVLTTLKENTEMDVSIEGEVTTIHPELVSTDNVSLQQGSAQCKEV